MNAPVGEQKPCLKRPYLSSGRPCESCGNQESRFVDEFYVWKESTGVRGVLNYIRGMPLSIR